MNAKINIRHMEGVTVLEVSGRIVLGEGGLSFAIPSTMFSRPVHRRSSSIWAA
jgi:hypothetical protein